MKIGILETGRPPGDLLERFGDYPAMFADLLGPGFEITSYDVEAGELPPHPEAQEAYLVTGSPSGVFDDLPWMAPLKDFLRGAKGKAKLVGVCFGHQIMAEAFGGRVEKSQRGWGVGLQTLAVYGAAPFLGGQREVSIPASHQDQVVEQPPATRILAANVFSPFGVLLYEDQPALSMQFHPEFSPAFAKALIERRGKDLLDPEGAKASLDRPNDSAAVGAWIRRFLLEESAP
jgi:GMP synthase-like glutamine amidotransferase